MPNSSPHKAVILLRIEVHEVLPTNECSGNPISRDILKEYGLDTKMTVSVDGFDMDNCLAKLKEKIDGFKQ